MILILSRLLKNEILRMKKGASAIRIFRNIQPAIKQDGNHPAPLNKPINTLVL